jgi:hypothetical protein
MCTQILLSHADVTLKTDAASFLLLCSEYTQRCKLLAFRSIVTEVLVLLGRDVALLDNWFPASRDNLVVSFRSVKLSKKMRPTFPEKSDTNYPVTLRHIPEGIPQLRRYHRHHHHHHNHNILICPINHCDPTLLPVNSYLCLGRYCSLGLY